MLKTLVAKTYDNKTIAFMFNGDSVTLNTIAKVERYMQHKFHDNNYIRIKEFKIIEHYNS